MNESEGKGTVTIGGLVINGWIDMDKLCPSCGSRTVFDFDCDARFCPSCDSWLEGACNDPSCGYCANRPARPMKREQRLR